MSIPIKTPPDAISIPLVHKITDLYKIIYILGKNVPKKDRHGLHLKIEQFSLEMLGLSIEAALLGGAAKIPILRKIKIETEILKWLVRLENELNIINTDKYLKIENGLIEISKMTSGWIKYLETKGA